MDKLWEEKRVECSLNELRKLIQDEPNLNCPKDDAFLVRFIRARKYDVKAAFKNVKLYYGIRLKHPKSFESFYPSKLRCVLESGCVGVLKHRDDFKRRVFVFKVGLWDPDLFNFDEVTMACMLLAEEMTYCQVSQKVGGVVIVDHQGLSISHARQLSVNGFRKLLQLFQDCFPARYKAIHLVNQPYLFDILFSIAKKFMTNKLKKRIHFHPDYQSLTESVHAGILPQSLGGTLKEDDAWDSDILEQLYNKNEFYKDMLQYGYKTNHTISNA